jgi:hypothetical protein
METSTARTSGTQPTAGRLFRQAPRSQAEAIVNPVTFSNISRLKYRAIVARIRAQADSTTDNGDSGSATGDTPLGRMYSRWTYNEAARTLTVTVTKKPLLITENYMVAKMRALVDSINV